MADDPRQNRQPPDGERPRPVLPPSRPAPRATPEDLEDLQLAPGDPYIKAAFDRVGKTTSRLAGPLGEAVRQADGTDSLQIHKLAKRSRVMSFQVQGIVWKAGFAKELSQTPIGTAFPGPGLPPTELEHEGAILRPISAELEGILRDLLPRTLREAEERMYGLDRALAGLCLYFVPRDEGAAAGLVAQYVDSPTSRRHALFLQTVVRRADPKILDQMLQTFQAALPMAKEAGVQPARQDFWHELERSLFQVRATYRTSALHERSAHVTTHLSTGLKRTGDRLESALGLLDRVGRGLEWILYLPLRGLLWVVQAMADLLVALIRGLDRLIGRR